MLHEWTAPSLTKKMMIVHTCRALSFVLLLCIFALTGCGGGGGDSPPVVVDNTLTIQGVVDDGTATSPIPNATCRLVDQNGNALGATAADAQGRYSLTVNVGVAGFITCTPPNLSTLGLTTFVSTVGQAQGATLSEDVTPATTLIAYIIDTTEPTDPQGVKTQLLADLAASEPSISLLVDATTILFNALLDASINVDFQSALNDLFVDGSLSQPELQPIALQVEQAIAAAEQQRGVELQSAAGMLLDIPFAPVASNDAIETSENTAVSGTLRASDANGDPLTFRIVTNGILGNAAITDPATGAFTYTPNANANGIDTFQFVANDGVADSPTATITVTIIPVNDAPVARDDTMIGTAVNTPVTIAVFVNDDDLDGDALTVVGVTQGSRGSVTTDGTTVTYSPGAGFVGSDTFSYTVSDSQGGTATANVTVEVTVTNSSPVVQNDASSTNEGIPVTIAVLANDTDPNGNTLSIVEVFTLNTTRGAATISGSNIIYTPPGGGFNGTDIFAYRACDNGTPVLCAQAQVMVTVNPVNAPPAVANPIADVVVNEEASPTVLDLSATFSDGDIATNGDRLTLSVVNTNSTLLTATLAGTQLTLTYQQDQSGQAVITVQATDLGGLSADDSVTVTVNPVNDLPQIMQLPTTQMSVVGQPITALDLRQAMKVEDAEDGDCAACTFTISNPPPNLRIDNGMLQGNIAYNAFSRGNGGNPIYQVAVTVTDRNEGKASGTFEWRVAQAPVEVIDSASGEGGGDGDGAADGEGGAEGDAGDGGDASPLALAECKFVGMDGMTPHEHINHVDGTAQPITATANDQGKFLLELPVNPDNPLFLKPLEGFVECSRPDKPNLVVSIYLNTAGMRANERIRLGQKTKVDPSSTVNREMFENLRTADSTADLVGIQARFADGIQGLATKSPEAVPMNVVNDTCTSTDTLTVKDALNMPLQNDRMDPTAPPIPPNPKATIAAYTASQLFLASLKVEDELQERNLLEDIADIDCPDDPLIATPGAGPNEFILALKQYFENDRISAENLVNLGLQGDKGIAIALSAC